MHFTTCTCRGAVAYGSLSHNQAAKAVEPLSKSCLSPISLNDLFSLVLSSRPKLSPWFETAVIMHLTIQRGSGWPGELVIIWLSSLLSVCQLGHSHLSSLIGLEQVRCMQVAPHPGLISVATKECIVNDLVIAYLRHCIGSGPCRSRHSF